MAGCLGAKNQTSFFDYIIMPLYTTLAKSFPGLLPLASQAGANYRHWKLALRTGDGAGRQDGRLPRELYEAEVREGRLPPTLEDRQTAEAAYLTGPSGRLKAAVKRNTREILRGAASARNLRQAASLQPLVGAPAGRLTEPGDFQSCHDLEAGQDSGTTKSSGSDHSMQ